MFASSLLTIGMGFKVAKFLYNKMLKDALQKAIDNPKTEWDDYTMMITDAFFALDNLDFEGGWELAQMLYAGVLRIPALAYVQSTETTFDDKLLAFCDQTFEYQA